MAAWLIAALVLTLSPELTLPEGVRQEPPRQRRFATGRFSGALVPDAASRSVLDSGAGQRLVYADCEPRVNLSFVASWAHRSVPAPAAAPSKRSANRLGERGPPSPA